ncbi:glycosyltransferase BC10-like [Silene latifolia]|uniref:glycosyltransferase BC10-like n=1 Tax=Silene latifolia TaxID=37657 RepID=UPI003D7829E8
MLLPNPFSLFCTILVCLPLALVFTLISFHPSILLTTQILTHPHLILPLRFPPPPPPPPPPLLLSPPPPHLPPPPTLPPPPPLLLSPPPPLPPPPTSPPSLPLPPPPAPLLTLPDNSKHDQLNKTTLTSKALPRSQPPPSPPPPYPEDDEDDVDLLKRASRVNPNPEGNPKKIAFLFLTTTPLPFAPIWQKFFNQPFQNKNYNIYIHTHPKLAKQNNTPVFTGVFQGRVIPSSKPTRRNTPTLIAAARRLLAHALLDDPNNSIFTILSAACIPLHSFNFTYHTLLSSNNSFIEILSNETTAYGRWAARGEDVMLPEIPLEDFRIGSQFWSLTRRHARVVVEDVKLWRKFRLPCVTPGTCFPEENYFPTLLSMVDSHGVVPATLTHVNWRGGHAGHPRMYNGSEVEPGLIRWLREGRPRYGNAGGNGTQRWDPFLFARKFATNCVQPLLTIVDDILLKD